MSQPTSTLTSEIIIRAWYVSRQRIVELIDPKSFDETTLNALHGPREWFTPGNLASLVGGPVYEWIKQQRIPTFHELALRKQLKEGSMFVYEGHLYGKGFGVSNKSPLVSLSKDVSEHVPGHRLIVGFGKAGITTDTAYTRLGGSTHLLVLGSITKIADGKIHAVPYIIGDLIERTREGFDLRVRGALQLQLSELAQFRKIDFDWTPTAAQFAKLRDIPEQEVKKALAALLGEIEVAKDWGGEENDLFSGNLIVGRRRRTAAFLLKGPARFHEMRLADCGKNGDQIYRLFHAPAEVFVVQHCHKISPAVRRTVEAFTLGQYARGARYLLIDGYDSCRILKSLKRL